MKSEIAMQWIVEEGMSRRRLERLPDRPYARGIRNSTLKEFGIRGQDDETFDHPSPSVDTCCTLD